MYSILFIVIIILLFILMKLLNIKYNNIFSIFLTLTVIYFLLNPKLCINASLNGAKLFFSSILPTMFPFMVICNMIISLDGINMYSKVLGPLICKPLNLSYNCSFALVASFLCGYPLGAKYSTDLYKEGIISKDEFSRLLNIASNISPLFLIGAVGTSMLGNAQFGYLLLIPSYLSCFIMGILTRNKKKKHLFPYKKGIKLPNIKNRNIGEIIKNSISDAALNTLILCGYIIIFSVVISMLKEILFSDKFIYNLCESFNISFDIISGIFLGSIEATNGCNIISSSNLDNLIKLSLISFLASFGGLSIIAQTTAFFYKEDVSIPKYFFFKFVQGIISFIIMFFTFSMFKQSIPTFATTTITYLYLTPILTLLLLTLLILIIYKLVFFS
ncbi:MAG: sporulation integral membrane protein YlbJ [Clostridium perfringens]|nr:sporulation integral membrane protein YlbJ [Clostridium perfringens]